ncbi:MAG: DUF3105 domain-containing protein [Rhodococcus sp.]|nr:DUF3105 domain-containing protein [Rhodococcus sp. (in: high G+C Gram-positive bacteria)]
MASGSDGRGSSSKSSAKSAKAIAAAQKKSKAKKKGGGVGGRNIPWMTLGGIAVVVALIAALAVNLYPKYQAEEEAKRWAPTEENQDPSDAIDGVVKVEYAASLHVNAPQRVAYDQTPPFGGPHDSYWANCMGTVYPVAIRTENAVHSLEHGAVWITYNPDTLPDDQRETLESKVDGKPYTMMSPYPGQEKPISLQSWGHQLAVESADDERVNQFISALRLNPYTHPEVGATCSTAPGTFDVDNPPPFDPTPPGPDAQPMDGSGLTLAPNTGEMTDPMGGLVPGGEGLPGGLPAGSIPPELQELLENPEGTGNPEGSGNPAGNGDSSGSAPADGSAPAGQ